MKGIIKVNNIRLYAYHGCLEEEGVIGGHYSVDVEMEADFSGVEQRDELSATLDYCTVYDIVKREMMIRSRLIEHVAMRILNGLKSGFPKAGNVKVSVHKWSPPVGGDVEEVSVTVEK
jgi:7,8-dihydroneopterin aldolase/epimerase/oxygenase